MAVVVGCRSQTGHRPWPLQALLKWLAIHLAALMRNYKHTKSREQWHLFPLITEWQALIAQT